MGPERQARAHRAYEEFSAALYSQEDILAAAIFLGIDSTNEEEVDRTRQLLGRFIEELYKVKREITEDMRTSFIQQTKAYQLNHQEWMDRLNTATKQKTLQALIPHLKNTKRFLSRLGDLHLDYRSQGQALALEIQRFLDFVAQTKVGANQPPHGGRVKHEYILLLVQLALFFKENQIKITSQYPTFEQVQNLASLMSELAQKRPLAVDQKKEGRLEDFTKIDENALRPIWGDIVENKLNLDEIDAAWSAQNYIDDLAVYYLDPKTPSSRG